MYLRVVQYRSTTIDLSLKRLEVHADSHEDRNIYHQ